VALKSQKKEMVSHLSMLKDQLIQVM
jgi:hypothetical protein